MSLLARIIIDGARRVAIQNRPLTAGFFDTEPTELTKSTISVEPTSDHTAAIRISDRCTWLSYAWRTQCASGCALCLEEVA